MSSSNVSGAITYSNGAVAISAGTAPQPQPIPRKDIVAVRAVEMKDGWVGQVLVGGNIVREETGFTSSDAAERWASKHIQDRLVRLFSK
jgi:hypothetical protein